MRSSVFRGIRLVFRKELTAGMRFKAAWLTMLMFALTTLACVSLSLGGASPEPEVAAALLWVILFFSAMTGVDRLFDDEEMSGTLLALRIYGSPQPVLFGKMLYGGTLLLAVTVFVVFLFLLFMDISFPLYGFFFLLPALLLGVIGLAVAGTFLAALSAGAGVRSGLFPVLMLPVTLPVLLPAVAVTAEVFGGTEARISHLGGMGAYDLILMLGASLLFDYFWYEE